jgi:hypothetical protein
MICISKRKAYVSNLVKPGFIYSVDILCALLRRAVFFFAGKKIHSQKVYKTSLFAHSSKVLDFSRFSANKAEIYKPG